MSSIRIYENKTFKLNNLLKYELHLNCPLCQGHFELV